MYDPALGKFLELVQRELGAADARLELGGRDPTHPSLVWCAADRGARVVAVFDSKPADAEPLRQRLEVLTRSFFDVAGPKIRAKLNRVAADAATTRLDGALEDLTERASAVACVVIDAQSPVIWGTNLPRGDWANVPAALRLAEQAAEPPALRLVDRTGDLDQAPRSWVFAARAIAAVRRRRSEDDPLPRETVRSNGFGYIVRPFATIYMMLLVFEGDFSELHAEGAVVHALPHIEHLVLAIPPLDTPPGGKALRLV